MPNRKTGILSGEIGMALVPISDMDRALDSGCFGSRFLISNRDYSCLNVYMFVLITGPGLDEEATSDSSRTFDR